VLVSPLQHYVNSIAAEGGNEEATVRSRSREGNWRAVKGRAAAPLTLVASRLVCLCLVQAVLLLTPVAHAIPPDQSWITGLYDNADFDDVILLIINDLNAIHPCTLSPIRAVDSVVSLVPLADTAAPLLCPLSFGPSRAPPLA
jgi:hypothetical protein